MDKIAAIVSLLNKAKNQSAVFVEQITMIKHKKSASKSSAKGLIRIIAGTHRARRLPVLLADGLRPTTDRVKETVFNWLMAYVPEARCLDCFAGSGGLGFEALSRGAKKVTMVELNKAAAQQLKVNGQTLKADNLTVENTDALSFLSTATEQFDVVFLDPPFRKNLIEKSANLLNQGWLADQALIYVEMESEHSEQELLPSNWQLLKEKKAGQVSYRLYQATSDN